MNNKDEYLVFVRYDKTRFYFKNRKLHREAGPAIVRPEDENKYTNLIDEELYKEVTDSLVSEYGLDEEKIIDLPNGKVLLILEEPMSYYLGSFYFLDGMQYKEQQFNAIKLRKELSEKLNQQNLLEKKSKV